MNMSREETMNTRSGEFKDLMNCWAVYNGTAKVKQKKLSFFEIMELR
jgi:hypothetical protein